MTRCRDCGRRKATDRQCDRWMRYASRHRPWWRREPLWFKFGTRCLGWYDCIAEWFPYNAGNANWYERRHAERAGILAVGREVPK